MSRQEDLKKIYDIDNMGSVAINFVNDGGSVVYRINFVLILFEVPLYGGEEQYVETYRMNKIHELLDRIYSMN